MTLHRLIQYSDRTGRHVEVRDVSRWDKDLQIALDRVIAAAYALSRGEEPAE